MNLDDITSPGQITSLEFVVTNGVGGEAVDLRAPSDSDADGTSDTDSKNTLVMTYSDKNQVVADIYWTKDFIGGQRLRRPAGDRREGEDHGESDGPCQRQALGEGPDVYRRAESPPKAA